MRTQSLILVAVLLSGCGTMNFNDAEPEKFINLTCDELDQLAETYRTEPTLDVFNDSDISDQQRMNRAPRDERVNYEEAWARDQRSIALTRRAKDCG